MRDPNRIDEIIERLRIVWKRNPDLRLGQIMGNSFRDPELYYVEDRALITRIEEVHRPVPEFDSSKKRINWNGI